MAANSGEPLSISVEEQQGASVVHLLGEVDLNVSPKLRSRLKELTGNRTASIVIDMAGVPYIDSSGVATLVECLQGVSRYGGSLRLAALTKRASGVFEISRLDTVFSIYSSLEGGSERVSGFVDRVAKLGAVTLDGVSYAGGLGHLGLDTLRWIGRGLIGRPRIEMRAVSFQMVRVGVKAIGIVVLVHFFIGMILSFEMAPVLKNYGMLTQLATIIVKSGFPQMAPIFSGIVLSGFAGAAIAAELGSMVVAEEIQALEAMALNPVRFLVVPRFIACVVMLFCLTIVADLAIWAGGLVVYVLPLARDEHQYTQIARDSLMVRDVWVGLIKSLFFAGLVSLVACYEGLRVTGGAEGVGRATTRSVVLGIVGIIILNLLLTILFFYFWPSA